MELWNFKYTCELSNRSVFLGGTVNWNIHYFEVLADICPSQNFQCIVFIEYCHTGTARALNQSKETSQCVDQVQGQSFIFLSKPYRQWAVTVSTKYSTITFQFHIEIDLCSWWQRRLIKRVFISFWIHNFNGYLISAQ